MNVGHRVHIFNFDLLFKLKQTTIEFFTINPFNCKSASIGKIEK